jgi:hypothetical protein
VENVFPLEMLPQVVLLESAVQAAKLPPVVLLLLSLMTTLQATDEGAQDADAVTTEVSRDNVPPMASASVFGRAMVCGMLIVSAALATLLFVYPDAVAIASTVAVALTVNALL